MLNRASLPPSPCAFLALSLSLSLALALAAIHGARLAGTLQTLPALDADGRVSVEHCRAVHRALTELEQWQTTPYKLARDEAIKVWAEAVTVPGGRLSRAVLC